MKDFPISQLRIVKIWFHTTDAMMHRDITVTPTIHMMHESQVDTFARATIELHAGKGNPKTGPLNNLWYLTVTPLSVETESYWWCHPELKANNRSDGAQLNKCYQNEKRLWAHPDLIADEKRAIELEAEYD